MEHNIISIRAFGIARDLLGHSSLEVNFPVQGTVGDLRTLLYREYPGLARLKSLAIAVNAEYVNDDRPIGQGDEVVLIPPVSGG